MKCPACRSSLLEVDGPLSWCDPCGHAFQTDLTVTADYEGAYGERTYATYPETTAHLRAGYILGRIRIGLSIGDRVLDVGYGNGAFLKVMQRAGFAVFGLDVHGKDYGIPEMPIDTACSVVTFFDSLEHIPDLETVRPIAKHVFISIPHRPEWFRQNPADWKHYKPGEHLHYFSPTSLRKFMSGVGYEMLDECSIEDATRGKLMFQGKSFDNIRTYHFWRQ